MTQAELISLNRESYADDERTAVRMEPSGIRDDSAADEMRQWNSWQASSSGWDIEFRLQLHVNAWHIDTLSVRDEITMTGG